MYNIINMIFDEKAFAVALGKRLRAYRGEKFTLDQVISEARLSISRSSLSAIENGNQDISARDLYAMSIMLGFSINDLMDGVRNDLLQDKFSINLNR